MKITVVIVTRNRSNSLKRCLEALVGQTIQPYEIIVVDSSWDNTKEVVLSFRDRLPVHYIFEKELGRPAARNRGLKRAKGDIVAFTDDDCQPFPDWIEQVMEAHQKYPYAAAIQGWVVSVPRSNHISTIAQFNFSNGYRDNVINKEAIITSLENPQTFQTPIFLFRIGTINSSFKLAILKALKLRFNPHFKREDEEISKRLLSHNQKIILHPSIKVYHWERSTIKDFLLQRFTYGRERITIRQNWPKGYFPSRKRFWWVRRGIDFTKFCIDNGHGAKLPILMPLFFVENVIYIGASYYGAIRLRKYIKLTNIPSSIQKSIAI